MKENNPAEHIFWQKFSNKPTKQPKYLPNSTQSTQHKAEIFASNFEKAFSNPIKPNRSNDTFNYYKPKKYNNSITLNEIDTAFTKTKNSNSTGPDLINNKLLKLLKPNTKEHIRNIFNAFSVFHIFLPAGKQQK